MPNLPAFFPTPIEGETVYSLCSRYHQRSGNRSDAHTFRQLFPAGYPKLSSLFPTHLNALSDRIGINPAELIANHTGLPLFKTFTSPTRYKAAIDVMCSAVGGSLDRKLAIAANEIYTGDQLRHCKICSLDDLTQYGTTIWHIYHQLPAVEICHKHGVKLQTLKPSRRRFVLPPSANHQHPPGSENSYNRELAILIADLWRWNLEYLPPSSFVNCYLFGLRKMGLITGHGRIRQERVSPLLQAHWHGKLPDTLNLSLTRWLSRTGFPANLLRGRPGNYHPVKHLLIIGLLFGRLDEFLMSTNDSSLLTKVAISLPPKKESGSTNKYDSQILNGLKAGLSLREISRNHGRSISFIRERALSNCIPVNRRRQKLTPEIERTIWRKLYIGCSSGQIAKDFQISSSLIESVMRCHPHLRELRSRIRKYGAIKIHRAVCTKYFRHYPTAHRNQFKVDCSRSYMWLYRHDRIWLYAHLPDAIERKYRSKYRIQARQL